jgi:hypothetical protein
MEYEKCGNRKILGLGCHVQLNLVGKIILFDCGEGIFHDM